MRSRHGGLFAILLTAIILLSQMSTVFGQDNDCNCQFNKTIGVHYVWANLEQGAGVELGLTGNESNFNLHWNIDVLERMFDNPKRATEGGFNGRIYMKGGYRIIRIPYHLSVYTNIIGGMSWENSFYGGAGLKILVPMNKKAISLEPMYVDHQFNLQVAFHIVV